MNHQTLLNFKKQDLYKIGLAQPSQFFMLGLMDQPIHFVSSNHKRKKQNPNTKNKNGTLDRSKSTLVLDSFLHPCLSHLKHHTFTKCLQSTNQISGSDPTASVQANQILIVASVLGVKTPHTPTTGTPS